LFLCVDALLWCSAGIEQLCTLERFHQGLLLLLLLKRALQARGFASQCLQITGEWLQQGFLVLQPHS
jgi:hypothetical protein